MMNSRQLINGALLAAVCIMCGCKMHTPGGSPLRVHWLDHHKSNRAWIRHKYCDPQRYTYHQTCWRPMTYDACCWEPEMPAENIEQDASMMRGEIIEGAPDENAPYPALVPTDYIPYP